MNGSIFSNGRLSLESGDSSGIWTIARPLQDFNDNVPSGTGTSSEAEDIARQSRGLLTDGPSLAKIPNRGQLRLRTTKRYQFIPACSFADQFILEVKAKSRRWVAVNPTGLQGLAHAHRPGLTRFVETEIDHQDENALEHPKLIVGTRVAETGLRVVGREHLLEETALL